MNKKILSIFVMIMALSLFGVSCSNSGTTGTDGNNNNNPTVVKFESVLNAIKDLKTITGTGNSDVIDFSSASAKSGDIALEITSGGNTKVVTSEIKAALTSALDGLKITGLTITSDISTVAAPTAGNKNPWKVTLTIKSSDTAKYKLDTDTFKTAGCTVKNDSTTLTLTFTPGENWADS